MADLSVKQQIIARILADLLPLAAGDAGAAKFRSVQRRTAPVFLANIVPALQIIVGPEHKIEDTNAGPVMEFPMDLWVIVSDPNDPYGLADQMSAPVQAAIESDQQLASLANSILYDGDQPYTNEIVKPLGGCVLLYTVQYRRQIAQPTKNF